MMIGGNERESRPLPWPRSQSLGAKRQATHGLLHHQGKPATIDYNSTKDPISSHSFMHVVYA
jgi:hypothetical protein